MVTRVLGDVRGCAVAGEEARHREGERERREQGEDPVVGQRRGALGHAVGDVALHRRRADSQTTAAVRIELLADATQHAVAGPVGVSRPRR